LVRIAVLPGDGIGPEVIGAAIRVLERVAERARLKLQLREGLVGGAAIDRTGRPLPEETLRLCREADAVLFGAVGGPRWDHLPVEARPERGLLVLRKALGLYANLRPVRAWPGVTGPLPIKPDRQQGADLVVVRELTGGLYYGRPRGVFSGRQGRRAVDTLRYTEAEIRRVLRAAFELARQRRRKVTSVDKANVLASSQLWRAVATEVAREYPDVELEHALVDSTAMALVSRPRDFDVIVTENMFGDILSDEAATLAGSLGMLPSASLGRGRRGLYEPVHGTAPDIAGRGVANPTGAILSVALMLRHSFGLTDEAAGIEAAVERTLAQGYRTADIAEPEARVVGTAEFTEAVIANL
jgi:3-isopropylmalate dehydrogenase